MPEPVKPGMPQRQYGVKLVLLQTLRKLPLPIGFLLAVLFWNPDFPWISFGLVAVGFVFPFTPLFRHLVEDWVRDRRAYTERRVPPKRD